MERLFQKSRDKATAAQGSVIGGISAPGSAQKAFEIRAFQNVLLVPASVEEVSRKATFRQPPGQEQKGGQADPSRDESHAVSRSGVLEGERNPQRTQNGDGAPFRALPENPCSRTDDLHDKFESWNSRDRRDIGYGERPAKVRPEALAGLKHGKVTWSRLGPDRARLNEQGIMGSVVANRLDDMKRFVDRHRAKKRHSLDAIMSDGSRSFHPLLAGFFTGLAGGCLLLGLNLHLASPGSLVRLLGVCAALGAAAFLPLVFIKREHGRPCRGEWAFMAILAFALAALAESQRSLYHEFLLNGIRRQLVSLSSAGILCGLLWIWAMLFQPDRKRSSIFLSAGIGLLLLTPLSIQRGRDPANLAPAPAIPKSTARSVIVIGLDGVSWDLVAAGASDGTLPVFKKLMARGVAGPLEPDSPYDRDALWTTVATGKRPTKHGVIASRAFDTLAGRLLLLPRPFRLPPPRELPFSPSIPLHGTMRRSLAFWEILARRGHESTLANWPGSFPAREGLLLWASDAAFEGSVYPAPDAMAPRSAAEKALLFRVEPRNVEKALVSSLLPADLSAADRRLAAPVEGVAKDLSVAGVTLAMLPGGPASASTVVFSGISGVTRVFGPSLARVPFAGVAPRNSDSRARSLNVYYRFLDDLVGDFVEREGQERTIFIFSPVSFGPPPPLESLVQFLRGQEPEAVPHGLEPGFLMISGAGIRSGARLTSATILDVAPTILVLAGEPIARDIDGRVLSEAFDERFAATATFPVVDSFEPGGPQ